MMQIHVKTLTGKSLPLQVEPTETILEVKETILLTEGIPAVQQRLVFKGIECADQLTLAQYNAQQDDVFHLILKLSGMISSFTSLDTTDPLIRYLMLTDEDRGATIVPIAELRAKSAKAKECESHSHHHLSPFLTFKLDPTPGILSLTQCNWLNCFLDYMWTATQGKPVNHVDMKLVVPDNLFVQLLGAIITPATQTDDDLSPRRVLKKLKSSFAMVPGSRGGPMIAFRMTKGPTKACIDFHCDGGYASATCQVALSDPNTDYKGGKLCYFVNDVLHVLEDRPIGSIVSHPRAVLHAVTTVTEGTRKSLFVVDEMNGLGYSDVIRVKKQHVTEFLAETRMCSNSGCSHFANHMFSTCGHRVVCSHCCDIYARCPRCRTPIN